MEFLQSSLRLVHSWLSSPESLLFDPALDSAVIRWTSRYLRTLTAEITRASEGLLRPLFISPSVLVLTTPMTSLEPAVQCVRLLFEELKGKQLYRNLNPKVKLFYIVNEFYYKRSKNRYCDSYSSEISSIYFLIHDAPFPTIPDYSVLDDPLFQIILF